MSVILIFYFISDEELRKEYIAQTHTEQKVRERPLCYIAPSFEDETDRLAEIVKQRQIMNERVGIIGPTNRLVHGLAKGLPFDSVLFPRLTERSFPWVHGVARQRILFVGIARATQWVYLSTINNYEISEMEILRKRS